MSVIQVVDAAFSYGRQEVFAGIHFEVNPQEVFCLLGPNGCGKTTLLDCILGALTLRQGTVRLNGTVSASLPRRQVARHIAYVPQQHERTFPYEVQEVVVMGRAAYTGLFSSPSGKDERLALEALETVGIGHLRHRPYTQVSGGEGRLVMIARALVQQTPAVIMDEPTAHLDWRHEMAVLETIVSLVRDRGVSVIIASHSPNHALYFENHGLTTTVALLHDRGFLAVGSPTEVITEENLRTLYGVRTSVVVCRSGNGTPIRHVIPTGAEKRLGV